MARYCGNCGANLNAGSKFCPGCGIPCNSALTASVEKKTKRKSKAPLIAVLFVVVLVAGFAIGYLCSGGKQENSVAMQQPNTSTTGVDFEDDEQEQRGSSDMVLSGTAARFEGAGYSSPEKAVEAYLEAMKNGDVYGMVETFAVETYVEHYNLKNQIEHVRSYSPAMAQKLVSENQYSQAINELSRLASITGRWDEQFLSMTDFADRYELQETIGPISEDEVAAFVDLLKEEDWMDLLAELEYGDVHVNEDVARLYPDLADYMDPSLQRFQEVLTNRQRVGGFDELAWTMTEFTFNGQNYYLCMDVACYDGRWYNYEAGGLCGSYIGADIYSAGVILQDEY